MKYNERKLYFALCVFGGDEISEGTKVSASDHYGVLAEVEFEK